MEPLVLTFDIGTQSARAVLVDDKGSILHKAQHHFDEPYFSLEPGWAEQRGEFYLEQLCALSQELKSASGADWARIAGVSVTTIRDTTICVDKNGVPLRPAILWLDKRETEGVAPLPFYKSAIFALVGMSEKVKLIRRISVCNWLMKNEPENWEKTHKYLMLSGYMHFCLCGRMIDSTANIIGHVPFDNKKKKWMSRSKLTYCVFPVPKSKLCELCPPGTVIGGISKAAAMQTGIAEGTPVIATGSDKGCESLGLSCTTPEKAAISFGTTATIQYTTDRYVEPQAFMPAYPAALESCWSPEIEIYRGYWLVAWFVNEFADKERREATELGVSPEDILNKRLGEVPAGCEGLVLQPYFTPGISMPRARGSIVGFSQVHTKMHLYRAIIEGINFALINGMKSLEKRMGVKTKALYLAGGGSQSAEICQITADMFGVPAYRTQTYEAAVIGSSMLSFTALGRFKSIEDAMKSMVHIRDVFEPNEQIHRCYERLYSDVFTKTYKRLKPIYRKSYI